MMSKKVKTLKKLVSVNESFDNDIKSGVIQEIDKYVKFEIALLFFKLNRKKLFSLSDNERNLILTLIDKDDYVIEGDCVVSDDNRYDIQYIINLIDRMRDVSRTDKVICVYFKQQENNKGSGNGCKIYNIGNYMNDIAFSSQERAVIFESALSINYITRPFIEETHESFVLRMSEVIRCLLFDKKINVEDIYFKLLSTYLRMYPFVSYGKEYIDFESLTLPQSSIGLPRFIIKDEYVSHLNKDEDSLKRSRNDYMRQLCTFSRYEGRAKKLADIAQNKIREIDIKLQECSYDYYMYIHSPKVYNYNLLAYLVESFGQGNIFVLNEDDNNPVVRFFYTNDRSVDFFSAMRLDVFRNLIDASKLMTFDDDVKVLEKRNN